MAESNRKNQPRRKRTNIKKNTKKGPVKCEASCETDDVFNEEQERWTEENVDSIIREIKSEVDDAAENENRTNLMVVMEDLKEEENFGVDDSSSCEDVSRSADIEIDISVSVVKGGKRASTYKGQQKSKSNLGGPSSSLDGEDSTNSEFARSVTSNKSGNSKVNEMDSDNESSEVQIVSDTEESSNDVMEVNGAAEPEEVLLKTENERRYPFRLSQSDYLKFTQTASRRNFNFSSTSGDQEQALESKESDENGEDEEPAKKGRFEIKNETNDENVDFESLQQARLERLNKLNEAVDFIKDILAKLAEKESANQDEQSSSSVVVKSETDDRINGEVDDAMIKEEREEIKNDIEMETQDVIVA